MGEPKKRAEKNGTEGGRREKSFNISLRRKYVTPQAILSTWIDWSDRSVKIPALDRPSRKINRTNIGHLLDIYRPGKFLFTFVTGLFSGRYFLWDRPAATKRLLDREIDWDLYLPANEKT